MLFLYISQGMRVFRGHGNVPSKQILARSAHLLILSLVFTTVKYPEILRSFLHTQDEHQTTARTLHSDMASRRQVLAFGAITALSTDDVHAAYAETDCPSATTRVVDAQKLFAESTRKDLERIASKVERTTGVKLFIIAPPQAVVRKPAQYSKYLSNLKSCIGLDKNSIVMTVGPDVTSSADGVIGINRGDGVAQKYQFRLTGAHSTAVERTFGTTAYVQANGYDRAVSLAAENMAACLYLVSEDTSSQECSVFALSQDRARQVLDAH